jgi:23S rRNA (pseudouridine1915-N3)-methyltransferase
MINKIRIIAVGKVKERYLLDGINEYLKRLKAFCKVEIIEMKDLGVQKEAIKMEEYLEDNRQASFLLDNNGKEYDSVEFAGFLKQREGTLNLVIGGSEGISSELKSKYPKIALSKMTFLHEMTRLILLEQIYRGYMIINNRVYHK